MVIVKLCFKLIVWNIVDWINRCQDWDRWIKRCVP